MLDGRIQMSLGFGIIGASILLYITNDPKFVFGFGIGTVIVGAIIAFFQGGKDDEI